MEGMEYKDKNNILTYKNRHIQIIMFISILYCLFI
jgi:hypothetical protein